MQTQTPTRRQRKLQKTEESKNSGRLPWRCRRCRKVASTRCRSLGMLMHGKKNLGEEHNEKHTIEGAVDRGQCLTSLRPPKTPDTPANALAALHQTSDGRKDCTPRLHQQSDRHSLRLRALAGTESPDKVRYLRFRAPSTNPDCGSWVI